MTEEPKKWLYAYRQIIKWDGKDQMMITLSEFPDAKLSESTLLGRIALSSIEGGN